MTDPVASNRRRGDSTRRLVGLLLVTLSPASPLGCAPTVDVIGVYFPGWLVSAVAGVVASYAVVLWLGRRSGTAGLADSGLLFLSLATGIALAVWWVCFSGL